MRALLLATGRLLGMVCMIGLVLPLWSCSGHHERRVSAVPPDVSARPNGTCELPLDVASRAIVGGLDSRRFGVLVSELAYRTPQGRHRLRGFLESDNRLSAQYGARGIYRACDVKDVDLLLKTAQRHKDEPAVVSDCVFAIAMLVGRHSLRFPGWRPDSNHIDSIKQWYEARETDILSNGYEGWWADEVRSAFAAYVDAPSNREYLEWSSQSIKSLCASPRGEIVVPLLMEMISKADTQVELQTLYPSLLVALGSYIGPSVVCSDVDDKRLKDHKDQLLTWWDGAKRKSVSEWIWFHATGKELSECDPAEVMDWVRRALDSKTVTKQYHGALLLQSILPLEADSFVAHHLFYRNLQAGESYAFEYTIANSRRLFSLWRIGDKVFEWNAKTGRYSINLKAK